MTIAALVIMFIACASWAMVPRLIPTADALIVLRNGGKPATALGIPRRTAALLIAVGASSSHSCSRTQPAANRNSLRKDPFP